MSVKRKYDRALMTTPHGASQFKNHTIRKAITPDMYGSRSTFIVRVLTRPLPLSTNDFKAVMGSIKKKDPLWESSNTARIVFMGRILTEGGDCLSPHMPIPDPCLIAPGNDELQAGCVAKLASWHTKFFSSENFDGKVPDIGDKVKVTIMPGDFKYNLQYAFFDALESVGDGAPDDKNCRSRLRAKFNAFRSKKLGDMLAVDYSSMPGGGSGGSGGTSGLPNARPGSLSLYKKPVGRYDVDFAAIKAALPCAPAPADASATNIKAYFGTAAFTDFKKSISKTEGDINSNNQAAYLGKYQFGVEALEDTRFLQKGVWKHLKRECKGQWESSKSCVMRILENKELAFKPDSSGKPTTTRYTSNWRGTAGVNHVNQYLGNTSAQERSMDALVQRKFNSIKGHVDLNNAADVAGMLGAAHLAGAGAAKCRDGKPCGAIGMRVGGSEKTDGNGTLSSTYYWKKGAAMCSALAAATP
tara:strand:+ start:1111 stop:2523 length:1413 start_codon:yes stop_codon:yes gene_type:complete